MTVAQLLGPELGVLIRDLVPGWLVPVFIGITHMGNIAFLLALFVLDYWFRNHRRGAHAIGLAIGGMALITALKFFFDAPRPPPEVNVVPISGYSFPSGHSVTAAIGYGILAYDVEIGPRWARYSVAGVMISLIALSRVVLGVHYVRDVIAGVAVGLAFLGIAIAITGHSPRPAFLLALGMAVVAFLVSGASHDGVAVLGSAVGAALTWERLESVPLVTSVKAKAALALGVLPVLLGMGYVSTLDSLPLVLVFVVNGFLMALILVSPHLIEPLQGSSPSTGAAAGSRS